MIPPFLQLLINQMQFSKKQEVRFSPRNRLDTIQEHQYNYSFRQLRQGLKQINSRNIQTNQLRREKLQNQINELNCDISYTFSNNISATTNNIASHHHFEISSILDEENKNLKKQNQYYVRKIKKMQERQKRFPCIRQKKQKYKSLFIQIVQELQQVNQESSTYKQEIREIKSVMMDNIGWLQKRCIPKKSVDQEQSFKSSGSQLFKTNTTKSQELDKLRLIQSIEQKLA